MLYDFYGELLNEHQKEIYEDVVFNDMSPSEIAREEGISRQGVHDLIKRCDKILKDYEEKLHLVRKFTDTRNDVNQIKTLISEFRNTNDLEIVNKIEKTTDKILSDI